MLKTNSKVVTTKVRTWILNNIATYGDYNNMLEPKGEGNTYTDSQFDELASWILYKMQDEKGGLPYRSRFEQFRDWACGLPTALRTADYYVEYPAVDVVGDLLEESPKERERFSELDALRLMDLLVFRELEKGERRWSRK